MPPQRPGDAKSGLGTSLIKALARQIEAQIEIATGPHGTTVSVTHATFESRLPSQISFFAEVPLSPAF
jgi:chemotaxis protein methyltransferase CheR